MACSNRATSASRRSALLVNSTADELPRIRSSSCHAMNAGHRVRSVWRSASRCWAVTLQRRPQAWQRRRSRASGSLRPRALRTGDDPDPSRGLGGSGTSTYMRSVSRSRCSFIELFRAQEPLIGLNPPASQLRAAAACSAGVPQPEPECFAAAAALRSAPLPACNSPPQGRWHF